MVIASLKFSWLCRRAPNLVPFDCRFDSRYPLDGPKCFAGSEECPGVIIFAVCGLFVYWLSRTFTLLYGSDTEVEEMLAHDVWLLRRVVSLVRSAFPPPTQVIG